MLTVSDAEAAIDFYQRAFGATEQTRFRSPTGQIVAQMSVGGHGFFVVDEDPNAFNNSPDTLGGTSVRINLVVDEADASFAQAIAAGAREVFPMADQPYGLRQGRVADPSGHHWLIGAPLTGRHPLTGTP
jgi:PhnB protein